MTPSLLWRGMLAGLVGAFVAATVALLFAEPSIDAAIAIVILTIIIRVSGSLVLIIVRTPVPHALPSEFVVYNFLSRPPSLALYLSGIYVIVRLLRRVVLLRHVCLLYHRILYDFSLHSWTLSSSSSSSCAACHTVRTCRDFKRIRSIDHTRCMRRVPVLSRWCISWYL